MSTNKHSLAYIALFLWISWPAGRAHADFIPNTDRCDTSDCGSTNGSLLMNRDLPANDKGEIWYCPITFWNVFDSDGDGGVSRGDVDEALVLLNGAFARMKMVFYIAEYRSIHNSTYFNLPDQATGQHMINTYAPQASSFISVFCVNSYSSCGFARLSISSTQAVVIRQDCFGSESYAERFVHEMGHYFDLLHTFEICYGCDCTDGSVDCSQVGDFVCDTNPNPTANAANAPDCQWAPVHEYEGCSGGAPAWNPQVNNYMSYFEPSCTNEFTPGQGDRARATLLTHQEDLYRFPASSPTHQYVSYEDRCGDFDDCGDTDDPWLSITEATEHISPGGVIFVDATTHRVGASWTPPKRLILHPWRGTLRLER